MYTHVYIYTYYIYNIHRGAYIYIYKIITYMYIYIHTLLHLFSNTGETCYKGKVAKACCLERLPGNKQACKWVRANRGGGGVSLVSIILVIRSRISECRTKSLLSGSYPNPFLGYLLFYITGANHKLRVCVNFQCGVWLQGLMLEGRCLTEKPGELAICPSLTPWLVL